MSASRAIRAAFAICVSALIGACSLIADFDASKLPREGAGGGPDAALGGAGFGGMIGNGGAGGGAAIGGFPVGGTSAGGAQSGGASGMPSDIDASIDGSLGSGGGGASGAGGQAGGGAGGAGGIGGAAGAGGVAGAAGGGGAGGAVSPPICNVSTNAGCAANELCCALGQSVTCRKTSLGECEQCGVACPAALTAACTGRTCQCQTGSNRVCSGQDAERFCAAGPPAACVGCRDATDCAGRADGKGRCVAGQCVQCDPTQASAGCSGNTPICDATTHTCKPCSSSPNNCTSPLVCTAGGACGHCASAVDCTTQTSPICDASTTQCRPCASNAECVAGPKLPYCVSQVCSSCNPSTEAGCTDPTKPDCRGDATGGYSCQPCNNNAHCANRPATPVCDTLTGSGRCVICSTDNDCTNAKTPLCVNNACVACDASSANATIADLRCAVKAGGQPACIRNGTQKGQCGTCDPGDSRGCTPSQLCCESAGVAACVSTSTTACTACAASPCDPLLTNTCTSRVCRCGSGAACTGTGTQRFCVASGCAECRADADCTSATAPLCEGNQCVGCDQAASSSTRCAAKQAATVCATTGTLKGHCAACDPASNAGCANATLNECDPATATCVDCVDNSGCSGTLDRCNVTTEKCVDCDATGGCTGTLDRCNLTTQTCVDCDATGGCSGTLDRCNVTTQTCVDCDMTGGCADVPATPICLASVCSVCTTDAQCAAAPGAAGPLCTKAGECVPDATCTQSTDCKDQVHIVCSGLEADGGGTGHCRVCDPATSAGCVPPQTCTPTFVCTG